MSPAAAYLRVLARFADFDGRASRAELWGFALVHAGVTAVVALASAVMGTVADVAWIAGSAVFALYAVGTFFPTLSAVARRLHDTGRSSLLVMVGLVPVVGLVLVYWLALPGDPGPNRYGQADEG
ncbi:DUF805 domain-containing protein [Rubrivirga sp.]|uniref:DUF805 domain-containing protein n=1 Tax=Rubrivirga sp. TaxID=1885344 RepID=UPI003B525D23